MNKRKKAGTSSKKGLQRPTKQDWENAAKTAKESTNEGLGDLSYGSRERPRNTNGPAELYKIAKYAIQTT